MAKQWKPAQYIVRCDTHGVMNREKIGEVKVSAPISRKTRVAGCPFCNKEK